MVEAVFTLTQTLSGVVSNADEKSGLANTDVLPLCGEMNRSLTTIRSTDSVL